MLKIISILFAIYFALHEISYAQYDDKLKYLNDFLANTVEAKSDFIQIAPDNEESRGQLFIKKSARKILWRYKTPIMVDILMHKNYITMYDYALEQYSYTHMDNVFTQFFLNTDTAKLFEKIYFIDDKKYHIEYNTKIDIENIQGILVITIFKNPLQLKKLEFIDASKSTTQIMFENFTYHKLGDDIFVIKGKKRQR